MSVLAVTIDVADPNTEVRPGYIRVMHPNRRAGHYHIVEVVVMPRWPSRIKGWIVGKDTM